MDKAKHDEHLKGSAARKHQASARETSGNLEESMGESASDAFGKQSSAKSGTTSLSSESSDSSEKPGPGGVEGASGNS